MAEIGQSELRSNAKKDGTMDVGFRTLRMRVRVRCLHECTERMLIRIWCILDVDSTVQQRLEPKARYFIKQ